MILLVLASDTVANGGTWHAGLVTLAILLQATTPLAIAPS